MTQLTEQELIIPPPTPKILNYPAVTGALVSLIFVSVLLIAVKRYDPTSGALTISLLVVLTMSSVVLFCLFFTVPQDPTTAAAVGGLVAGFGAVVSRWLIPPRA